MEIFDIHNDYLTKYKTNKQKLNYLHRANNDNNTIISAIWTSNIKSENCLPFIDNCKALLTSKNNYIAIEDLHFVSYDNIDEIAQMKPKYAGLTWNYENKLCGGADTNIGFSTFGKLAAHKLEAEGIQIDTAHLSEKGFLDFAGLTERPILCSHTAFDSLCSHNRNLKDYQIKIIEASKGLIGVAFVSEFLTNNGKASIKDVIKHIDYYCQNYNYTCLALGTDFCGTSNYPKGIKDYCSITKIGVELTKMGYSQSIIEDIFYNNANRFFTNNQVFTQQ